MKTTKLITAAFALGTFLCVVSCGKEANGELSKEQYLTCKLDGKDYTFNFRVNANDKPSEKEIHFVTIGGWEKDDMIAGFGIGLVVPGDGAKETTYTVAGGAEPELDGTYYIQKMKDGQINGTTEYSGGRSTGTSFTLTITSLTSWGVKGTFSGKLRLSGGNTYITVTEGKFSAPYN